MITRRMASGLVAGIVLSAGVAVAGAGPGSAAPAAGGHFSSSSSSSSWTAGGLIDGSPGALPARQLMTGAPGTGSTGFAQVGACTFYATSASAGAYCGAGYGGPNPPSLQAWLAGRPFIPCRFFEVPTGMVINGGTAPGGHWMLKACFENVDPTKPWAAPT